MLTLPYLYTPRDYQQTFWSAMSAGAKRAFLVWHRQSGKDKTAWNFIIKEAVTGPVPAQYYYFAPTYAQGKKIIWDGIDDLGVPFLAHVPPELLVGRNETEMQLRIRHVSGGVSILQIVGTDNIDSVRGTRPRGCVFSEYAFHNPRAWEVIEPILIANGGWAVFITTPNGKNHAYRLWEYASRHPQEWYTSLLTIRDTKRADGSPVIDEAWIERLRARGTSEETIQREYYCSFAGSVEGAYYARLIDLAYQQGRVRPLPHDPRYRVETWWDIGVGDQTAIWFVQRVGNLFHIIDYHEAQGEGLPYYAALLQSKQQQHGYVYARHVMPHDVAVRDWSTGVSRYQVAVKLGIRPIKINPRLPVDEGIQAVRMILPVCYFDEERCRRGLDALQNYRKAWDDYHQTFRDQPVHDWSSHAADAFRMGAVASNTWAEDDQAQVPRAEMDFDIFAYGQERV